MATPITAGTTLFSQSSLFTLTLKPQIYSSNNLIHSSHNLHRIRFLTSPNEDLGFHQINHRNSEPSLKRGVSSVCIYDSNDSSNGKGSGFDWIDRFCYDRGSVSRYHLPHLLVD